MSAYHDTVESFIVNETPLDYRGGAPRVNEDLAVILVDQFGGDRAFQTAWPNVVSVGIEDIEGYNDSSELLYLFDDYKDALLNEMALIGQGASGVVRTAVDFIESNTDGQFTEDEIKDALAESDSRDYDPETASENRIAIAEWVCHQAASELCSNFREYLLRIDGEYE